MRLQELLNRKKALAQDIVKRKDTMSVEELRKANRELEEINEEIEKITEEAEERKNLLEKIAAGEVVGAKLRFFDEDEEDDTPADPVEAEIEEERKKRGEGREYRKAYLNKLRGLQLSDVERRAITTIKADQSSLPVETEVRLFDKIKSRVGFLERVSLTRVNGAVSVYVDGEPDGTVDVHTEGAKLTPDKAPLVRVDLMAYELAKLVQISESVKAMTIEEFENWLVDKLSRVLGKSIVNFIVNGTGTNQPKGIEKAATWGADNSITIAANAKPTTSDVNKLIGLLPSDYEADACWIMSKKTFWQDYADLQDNAKHSLVKFENGKTYIQGYEVEFIDNVKLNEAYLGDPTTVAVNFGSDVRIRDGYDLDTASYKYLGIGVFDCKPAVASAWVKMAKAS